MMNQIRQAGDYRLNRVHFAEGAFGNRTRCDMSGFICEINRLSSEKNPLRSLRVRLPNAPGVDAMAPGVVYVVKMKKKIISVAKWLLSSYWLSKSLVFSSANCLLHLCLCQASRLQESRWSS
jgi:hypothetical protein